VKLEDKMFLWANKKPSGKFGVYFATVVPWFMIGCLFTILLVELGAKEWFSAAVTGVLMIGYGLLVCIWDSKKGYVKGLYENYLARRKELMEKYGIEEK